MKTKKILLSNATNSKLPDDQLSRIFVGNLNTSQISKKHVLKLFGKFGQIKAISMHRGYAFVQFFYKEHASAAIRKMHGQLIGGQVIDVNLVTEPKPYQKKLTFGDHHRSTTKPIESKMDIQLENPKKSIESTVRCSPKDLFKKESPKSYSSERVSYLDSKPHLAGKPHPPKEPSSGYAAVSQNLITSSTEQTSSSASSHRSSPPYLNSTNQTKKAVRPPVRQQTIKLPYALASFEALWSSIYEQARLNQRLPATNSQLNSNQLNGNRLYGYQTTSSQISSQLNNQLNGYQSSIQLQGLQTYGQQPIGYDLIVCGTCKRVFHHFSLFVQHKQAICPLTSPTDLCITNTR